METRFGASFKICVWSTRTIRHQKKRYVLLPALESFMVLVAWYGHRGDVTLNIEPETCINILVAQQERALTQWRGIANFVGMMHGYPDLVPAIEKIRRVKGPGCSTVQRVIGGHAIVVLQGFHGVVDGSVDEKGHGEHSEPSIEGVAPAVGQQHPCIPPKPASS